MKINLKCVAKCGTYFGLGNGKQATLLLAVAIGLSFSVVCLRESHF